MSEGDLYAGREQTLVKHYILEHYLERFAHIVGSAWDAITYVDCFSGPWNARSERLEDSSFAVALAQLRAARTNLTDLKRARGRPLLELRCYFLEKDAAAFTKLREFAMGIGDVEIGTRNAALEESIHEIVAFVSERQSDAFPFIFVDPTGWTGFGLDVIQPLLRLRPGEVLVNFMTGHILRFAEHPDPTIQQSFDRLFGSTEYRARIVGLAGLDREDELVRCYCDAIRQAGGYDYVCTAIVLHPEYDRTHFHLIYATRSQKGVEVFKQVEKKAMGVMEKARSDAQKRRREAQSGQLDLLSATQMHDPRHYDSLRERHLAVAKSKTEELLQASRTLAFDDAWVAALSHPLVWESDLKSWIGEWKKDGRIEIAGMKPNERFPSRGRGHQLVRKGQ
ncbi:MAG: three-Cys-motif partner protein TcmP [Phycisphaerales bacterium]|nr:three-Cys-motif partner protein TcmP [Phycisphaerales bacterium]